ncbi:MAG: IGHMBP2 family helicase [Candidatus Aenigmarchaeota archaeon]|nr:IGHMBP2 family helicase [Candidatus Aenigmarchaeota archaeon]
MGKTEKRFINHLKKLITLERNAEINAMRSEISKISGKEREKRGRAILNLKGKVIGKELGYILVKFGRSKPFETEIKVGDLVLISRGNPLASNLVGTVVEKGKRFITVAVDQIYRWALTNEVRIDLYANDITFKRMIENLNNLTEYGKKAIKFLLLKEKPKKPKKVSFTPVDDDLNESQLEAVSLALGSKDFFLVHGPPGTGKTRTLIELIIQEVKRGHKVLATAESNVAVDNLVAGLADKVKLVRLGHPARAAKKLKETTLAFKLESINLYKRAERLREKAEKLLKKRNKFQRPVSEWRRGLGDKEIMKLAMKRKGSRGIPAKLIESMATWISLNKEAKRLYEQAKKLEERAIQKIIKDVDVVLATNSSAGLEFLEGIEFDVAIIDEGSQATTPSALIPINKAKRFVIAGDHRQLPPTILSEEAKDLADTLFEKLIISHPENSSMLRIQYRMNEKIMEFPNKEFYGSKLIADESVKNITLADLPIKEPKRFVEILDLKEPIVFVDTSKNKNKWERQRKDSKSRENKLEAEIVKQLVKEFLKTGVEKEWIGVITPYDDQVDLIKSLIPEDIEVHSVDGFQGREKEIIILSFVRSNRKAELGFLTDLRRLNVSITRAKRKLIAIGDSRTLSTNRTYKRFVNYIQKNGKYVEWV